MELPEHLKDKSSDELEEWFVEALSADPLPADEMLGLLCFLGGSGADALAREWAELMQDALQGPSYADAAMRLLNVRLTWDDGSPGFRRACRKALTAVFTSRLGVAFVDSVGFDRDDMPLAECLRRLNVLASLDDGVLCHDKTWGFGVVKKHDVFYRKITIDFDSRCGHQMSFEYAGETLELIDDDHLMARRFSNPEELAGLVRDDASQVVKSALKSYGPMSAPELQDLLVPAVVAEEDWKRFWADARKALKSDALVDLPAKRNEPIRLLAAEKEYGDQWFEELRAERDIQRIIDLIDEWESQPGSIESFSPEQRAVLSERMAFCIRGSEWQRPDRVARFLMLSKRLGFSELPEGDADAVSWRINIGETTGRMLAPALFVAALVTLPARSIEPFLNHMVEFDPGATSDLVLDVVNRIPLTGLKAGLDLLVSQSRQVECGDRLRSLIHERQAGPTLVYWACSNIDRVEDWSLAALPDLLAAAIDTLGGDHSGDDLKASNQLESLFEDRNWLEQVFGKVDGQNRRNLLKRVRSMRGIDAVQRRSIMARIIKLFPELEHELEPDSEDAVAGKRRKYTSWRSYNRRREELKNLVEVMIPANSKEIAVARSYGDLSENHEYKAAKEHQGILLRRREELERDLMQVQGTDFADFPTGKAGMGVSVGIRRPDGALQQYCVLGEWDGDRELGIISSESRLAQLLEGHGVGDEVRLPVSGSGAGPDDEEVCVITSISEPDAAIRTYLT